jgi:antitoxin Phd
MSATWQVQEAKSHFSELMERAVRDGPQVITRHGKPVVKVVAVDADDSEAKGTDAEWLEFLLNAPKSGLPEGLPAMPRSTRSRKPLFGD